MTCKKMKLLKVYVSSTDRINHVLLYEIIAKKAKDFGIAGATAARAMLGYGPSSILRDTRFFELVEKYPVIMEMVDTPEKIDQFLEKELLPFLENQPKGCMVYTFDVDVHLAKMGDTKIKKCQCEE